jgi:hypothetical protein
MLKNTATPVGVVEAVLEKVLVTGVTYDTCAPAAAGTPAAAMAARKAEATRGMLPLR